MEIYTKVPFSFRRSYGYFLQLCYFLKNSWAGVLGSIYFPIITMVLWGFTTSFMKDHSATIAAATGIFVGAQALAEIFFRMYTSMAATFAHDIRSRSLTSLMASPLQLTEMMSSMLVMALIRNFVCAVPAFILADVFFNVDIRELGIDLYFILFNLTLLGWWMGTWMTVLVLKSGLAMQRMIYGSVLAFNVIACIQFPLEALPQLLKPLSYLFPASYIFEAFRGILMHQPDVSGLIIKATALNLFYMIIMYRYYFKGFKRAMASGRSISLGE